MSKALDAWAHRRGVKLEFSRPGKPTDIALIESFNDRLRQECLKSELVSLSLRKRGRRSKIGVRTTTNIDHTARLDQQTPSEFVAGWQQTRADQKAGFLTHELVQ